MSLTIQLPRAVIEMHRFCCLDGCRENIARVRLEVEKAGTVPQMIAIATDGHRMLVYRWDAKGHLEDSDMEFEPICIDGLALKEASKGSKKTDTFYLEIEGTEVKIHRGPISVNATSEMKAESFPDWRKVEPKLADSCLPVGFNAAYVGDFAAWLKKLGETPNITIHTDKYNGPMLLDPECSIGDEMGKALYTLMPCRMGSTEAACKAEQKRGAA